MSILFDKDHLSTQRKDEKEQKAISLSFCAPNVLMPDIISSRTTSTAAFPPFRPSRLREPQVGLMPEPGAKALANHV